MRWLDYITINTYWFGLSALAQTMTSLVVPLLVQQFMGEASQGAYYGTLRLWVLMTAVLVQAMMGSVSDRSQSRFGRRRPFILAGAAASILLITMIGISASMDGLTGYVFLFGMMILLSIASNTSQAAQQGLITDLVPPALRGRFSGVKALFEIPLPTIFVSVAVAGFISRGMLWPALVMVMAAVLFTAALTMAVPEKPADAVPLQVDGSSLPRLVGMTAVFTGIILLAGQAVRQVQTISLLIPALPGALLVTAFTGLVGMGLAVAGGVWLSIRAGLGQQAAGNTSFTWWVINRLAFLAGATNLGSFALYFLQGRLGYIREQAAGPASRLIMFVGICILVSALPAGWLADRWGPKVLVRAAGILSLAGTITILAVPSLPVIYLGGALAGLAAGLFFPSSWALGTRLVPASEAGRYLGIANLAGAGAGAVGAYIGGPLADQAAAAFPAFPGIGYILLFSIFACLFLFSIFALHFVHLPAEHSTHGQLA